MRRRASVLCASHCSTCRVSARRGVRYPRQAHDGAVSAALRLRCDARPEAAPHNSLRSLRSLRSDKCGESDHEARAARAPASGLRFSPPHKSPTVGTAHRAATLAMIVDKYAGVVGKAVGGCAAARFMRRRGAQGCEGEPGAAQAATGRRGLASTEHRRDARASCRPCEGEFRSRPRNPSTAGHRRAAPALHHERRRTPTRGFARSCL